MRTSSLRIAALLLPIAACGDDSAAASDAFEPVPDAGYRDTSERDTGASDPIECVLEPRADSDGDGLLDVVEDHDRDCVVDADETDPLNPDTDGDGLTDGSEDVDRNGRWDEDRGEFDPRRADTDADGVPDGEAPLAAICSADLLIAAAEVAISEGRTAAVSAELEVVRSGDAAWVTGDDGALMLAELPWERAPSIYVDGITLAAAAGTDTGWMARYSAKDDLAHYLDDYIGDWFAPATEWFGGLDGDIFQLEMARRGEFADVAMASAWGDRDGAKEWLREARVAVMGSGGGRLRVSCERAALSTLPPALTVVVAIDASPAGLVGLDEAVEAVAAAVEVREREGLSTRVVLTRGDAHTASSTAAFVELDGAAALRRAVGEQTAGDVDQRVWRAAERAIDGLGGDEPRVVVIVSPREDVGFHEGVNQGMDGHPLQPVLGAGPARGALTQYYAERLKASDADVLVVRAGGCDDVLETPVSLVDVPLAADGVYVDACAPLGRDVLNGVMRERLGAARVARVRGAPSAGRPDVVVDGAEASPPPFGSGIDVVAAGEGDVSAYAAYVYWDESVLE